MFKTFFIKILISLQHLNYFLKIILKGTINVMFSDIHF